ncbi:MAG TPA: hypothetical protein VFU56_03980 [Gaiellaceae bacterium]|nr:hypothetical protein [Gaiellaceae bacterium]
MDSLGTARLIEEVDPRRAVAASVPRQEIETILQDPEAQPELQLEIESGAEPATISMDWSRDELEELFARARSDTVLLMFDGQELADAVADVEAHGLRQRALVFTVAATGTIGSGAGIANAAIPADFADGGGPAVTATAATPVTDVSSTDGYGTTAAASSGTTISLDRVATDAFVVGGVLLTIAGATFASRRVRPARPA